MRLRSFLYTMALSLAVTCSGAFAATLTLKESRQVAQAALLQGQPEVTLQIAQALIRVNPRDSHALLLISAANRSMGNPVPGRKAAAIAYRISDHPPQRYQAAQLAAEHALFENRPTLSQIWLRRASLHAKSEEDVTRIANAYSRVRNINPWSFRADLSIRPSSNINNGADSAYQIIDGVPVVGELSGDAQALSGIVGTTRLSIGYRLKQSDRYWTSLGFRSEVRRVSLSSEAKRQAPDTSSREFAYTYAELSLSHAFSVGQQKGSYVRLAATAAGLWDMEGLSYNLTRVDAERGWQLEGGQRLSFGGAITHYDRDGETADSLSLSLRASYRQKLENGDSLGVTLALENTDSDDGNRVSNSVNLRLSYGFAKKLGPAKASASLSLTHADYPDYSLGPFIDVPGGRQDTGAYADLSLFFDDYDYAGFAPKVTFRAGKTTSNVSRFETRQFSVLVGIQSKF